MMHLSFVFWAFLQACFVFSPKTPEDCQQRSREGCFDCLADINPEGHRIYQEAIHDNCYCGFECSEHCDAYCTLSDDIPADDCQSCFQRVSADPLSICLSDFLDECVEDDDCMMFILALKECEPS